MSDFLYSSDPGEAGELTRRLRVLAEDYGARPVATYVGSWGALAAVDNHYHGFGAVDTAESITLVVGGPVLSFDTAATTPPEASSARTHAVSARAADGNMKWDTDLSGPFAVLTIDKAIGAVTLVTDLMLWIPVYFHREGDVLRMATHPDVLARCAVRSVPLDNVAIVDFLLNGAVTFPGTIYDDIHQLHPATVYRISPPTGKSGAVIDHRPYWTPREREPYRSIDEAADQVRSGLTEYVRLATRGMSSVAHFISGGEDSRVVAALLPSELKRDAIVFVDSPNRESRIAGRAASAYGASFIPIYRSPLHYLDILERASRLVGTGHEYAHAHAMGFERQIDLAAYHGVFGGYSSDTFLKGLYAAKRGGSTRWPFVPEYPVPGSSPQLTRSSLAIRSDLMAEVTRRRQQHMERVATMRPATAAEWSAIWPSTMRPGIPNIFVNRRLFRSYEVFAANCVVEASSRIPTPWKLNRRIFHRVSRPLLKRSWWLWQSTGRLPFFPWWANLPVFAGYTIGSRMLRKLGFAATNDGPWGDWDAVLKTPSWQSLVRQNSGEFGRLSDLFECPNLAAVLADKTMTRAMKVNLIQMLHQIGSDTGLPN